MNWRRGGRTSALCGLFGTLVLGGCAGSGDKSDLASNADTSKAPTAREVSATGPGGVDKIFCVPALGTTIDRTKTIGSSGDTILVYHERPHQPAMLVARLTVPKNAVDQATDFEVIVPPGNRAYARVQAKRNDAPFTGPFPNNLELAIYYNRGCRTTAGGVPAEQVPDLNGFQVDPSQESAPDPDPAISVPGTNDHSTSVALKLEHLSGYILAQGIISGILPDSLPPPPDSTSPPAR